MAKFVCTLLVRKVRAPGFINRFKSNPEFDLMGGSAKVFVDNRLIRKLEGKVSDAEGNEGRGYFFEVDGAEAGQLIVIPESDVQCIVRRVP